MAEFGENKERERRGRGLGARIGWAFLGALAVLLLAAFTWSALFLAPPNWHLRFDMNNAPAWFAAIVSSFSVVAFYLLHRQSGTRDMEAISTGMGSVPSSKGEIASRCIDLELDAKTFKKRYGQLAHVGDEIMLMCEEVPAKGEKTYSTDEIREQIEFLRDSQLRERVQWVVFVTNENNFVAFQDFDTFLASVLNEQANRYRKALNIKDAAAFREAIEGMSHKQANTTYRPNDSDSEETAIVFGLNFFSIERSTSRKDMIAYMKGKRIGEVMVVAKKKPIGVVRLSDLVDSVLGSMF